MQLKNCHCDNCEASEKFWWYNQCQAAMLMKMGHEEEFKCSECGDQIHNKSLAFKALEKTKETGIPHRVLCCSCYNKVFNSEKSYEMRINEMRRPTRVEDVIDI